MIPIDIVTRSFFLILLPLSLATWITGFTYQTLKDAFNPGRTDAES